MALTESSPFSHYHRKIRSVYPALTGRATGQSINGSISSTENASAPSLDETLKTHRLPSHLRKQMYLEMLSQKHTSYVSKLVTQTRLDIPPDCHDTFDRSSDSKDRIVTYALERVKSVYSCVECCTALKQNKGETERNQGNNIHRPSTGMSCKRPTSRKEGTKSDKIGGADANSCTARSEESTDFLEQCIEPVKFPSKIGDTSVATVLEDFHVHPDEKPHDPDRTDNGKRSPVQCDQPTDPHDGQPNQPFAASSHNPSSFTLLLIGDENFADYNSDPPRVPWPTDRTHHGTWCVPVPDSGQPDWNSSTKRNQPTGDLLNRLSEEKPVQPAGQQSFHNLKTMQYLTSVSPKMSAIPAPNRNPFYETVASSPVFSP